METREIDEFELGKSCFGEILRVNGVDYEELCPDEVMELIMDVMMNDINKSNFIKETFQSALEYLQYDLVDSDSSSCDQCGDWNHYEKYVKNER